MATLPPNYLAKHGEWMRRFRLQDVVTLIHNVRVGAGRKDVGFEDCMETLETLCRKLDTKVALPPAVFESALWSCNLMNEVGEFWDVRGRDLETFIKEALPTGDHFDFRYNFLKDRSYK